jgi:hypothetical protein
MPEYSPMRISPYAPNPVYDSVTYSAFAPYDLPVFELPTFDIVPIFEGLVDTLVASVVAIISEIWYYVLIIVIAYVGVRVGLEILQSVLLRDALGGASGVRYSLSGEKEIWVDYDGEEPGEWVVDRSGW